MEDEDVLVLPGESAPPPLPHPTPQPCYAPERELELLLQGRPLEQPHSQGTAYSEASHYINDPPTKSEAPILEWWRDHVKQYPRLAKMARDVLAIPIAGVGCERVFNEARDVVTYRRNRLDPSTISDIMISKLHWKNTS